MRPGFKILGNQFPGFLIIFELVGLHINCGFSRLKDLTVCVALAGLVLFIDGFGFAGAGDLVLHLNVVVPGVGTKELHFHIAVGNLRLNLHRKFRGVFEFEVRRAPADGGIHTQIDIGSREAVIDTLHNLHIRQQRAVVQRGGALADAAAQGILQFLTGIGRRHLVALFGSPLAQGLVVRKGFAGLQDHAVESLTHDPQVGVPVFIASVRSFAGAQHIPEENIIRFRRGDVLHADTQGISVLAACKKRLCFFQVKAIAVGTGHNLIGIGIYAGIHRCHIQLPIDGIQVQRIRFRVFRHISHFHQKYVHAVCVQDLCVQLLNVQTEAGCTQGQHQGLAGGAFIKALGAEIGLFPLQGVAGLGKLPGVFSGIFVQGLLNVFFIQFQVGKKTDGVIAGERILIILFLLGLGSGTSVGKSGVHRGGYIQLGACFLGGESQCFPGELNHHVLLGEGVGCGPFYGGYGLTAGHAADVDTGHHHIVQDPVAVGIVCGPAYAEPDYQLNADKQYGSGGAQTGKDTLPVIIHEVHKALGKGGGGFFFPTVIFFRLLGSAGLVRAAGGKNLLIVNRGHGRRKVRGFGGSFRFRRGSVLARCVIQI